VTRRHAVPSAKTTKSVHRNKRVTKTPNSPMATRKKWISTACKDAKVLQMSWTVLITGIDGGIYRNFVALQERKPDTFH
jgi:hypothetical protein